MAVYVQYSTLQIQSPTREDYKFVYGVSVDSEVEISGKWKSY